MTLKVIGFKEYVYICISLHSVGLKVLKEKKIKERKRGLNILLWGHLFL